MLRDTSSKERYNLVDSIKKSDVITFGQGDELLSISDKENFVELFELKSWLETDDDVVFETHIYNDDVLLFSLSKMDNTYYIQLNKIYIIKNMSAEDEEFLDFFLNK
jgi:hypothetical protein